MIIFLIVGIIFALIGVFTLLSAKGRKERCTSTTTGKVTEIVKDVSRVHSTRNNRNYGSGTNVRVGNVNIGIGNAPYGNTGYRTVFYPVIEYQVKDIQYVKKSSTGSSSPSYGIGQELEVHYNPNDPNEFYIGKEKSSMAIGGVMTFFGVAFIAIFVVAQFIL